MFPPAQARVLDLTNRHPMDDRFFVKPKLLSNSRLPSICMFCSSKDATVTRELLCTWACLDLCSACRDGGRLELCAALHTWDVGDTTRYQDSNGDEWVIYEGEMAIRKTGSTFIVMAHGTALDVHAFVSVREGDKPGSVVVTQTTTQARLKSIKKAAFEASRSSPSPETVVLPG
jgi:hypothetical protein